MENFEITKILGPDAKIISKMQGGMMNLSYLVKALDKDYILYISTPEANLMVNREKEKKDQEIIYSLGITSKNIYFDTKRGIKINEFIKGDSLNNINEYEPKKVANLLKKLHESKILSSEDYLPFNRLLKYKKEALEVAELAEDYYKLEKVLLANKEFLEKQKKVLSHNDAQRSNVVKGDGNEYYLIDFEFVGNNDEIYDIACFGNGLVEEGYEVLKEYFIEPTKEEKQRYYLWRIYLSLQWYLVATRKHYNGEGIKHGYNFLEVGKHFLDNALTAYRYYQDLEK